MLKARLLCESLNLTEDRAQELLVKYLPTPWKQYMAGEISAGCILKALCEQDELTTNEKVFLAAHLFGHVQIYEIREMFLHNDARGMLTRLGLM